MSDYDIEPPLYADVFEQLTQGSVVRNLSEIKSITYRKRVTQGESTVEEECTFVLELRPAEMQK